jgi:hypothetical protein
MWKGLGLMPMYRVMTDVVYSFQVEAENQEDAEQAGWDWEDHKYSVEVNSIEVEEVEE